MCYAAGVMALRGSRHFPGQKRLVLRRLLALLALAAAPAGAAQWQVHSERGQEDVARLVSELLPPMQQELERRLGLALRGQGTVVLCASTESFRRATPGIDHRHTLGVAFPAERVMYLNCELIERQPLENVAITLRHELSHIIVGEVVRRGYRRVPLWFDEGVAVWTSGKVPFYDTSDYERAVAAGTLFGLAELADRFPLDPRERGVAYEQSESAVRFLVRSRGEGVVAAILQAAGRGVEFDMAFREAAGMDLSEFEERWLASIRPGLPWLSWIVNAFSLFGAMSLFAVIAFWVYWRRRRRQYQEWELEEAQADCGWWTSGHGLGGGRPTTGGTDGHR